MKFNKQTGFTLVELAIVMTIIGLLIGGILKGQELLENARVTSTLAQVKSYDSSVTAFRDIYDGLPGDLPVANTRVPGCAAASCGYAATATNTGDGNIGPATWGTAWGNQATTILTAVQTAVDAETTLFWIHMLQASLIGGVTNTALTTSTTATWGITHPANKLGGGFVVGNSAGTLPTGAPAGSVINGILLAMTTTPTAALTSTTAGSNVLTPGRAAQIDRKMDDGVPNTGSIRAFGATTCFGAAAPWAYTESTTTKDCGLLVKIQS